MKKILVVLLLYCTPSQAGLAEVLAYEHACDELTILYPQVMNCIAIPSPMVIYTKLVRYKDKKDKTTDGLFVDGEPLVFVYPNLRDRLRVVVHELSHYIMYETGVDKGMDICEKERIARKVAGNRWGPSERVLYGCK